VNCKNHSSLVRSSKEPMASSPPENCGTATFDFERKSKFALNLGSKRTPFAKIVSFVFATR
jgi:hypothetical protein